MNYASLNLTVQVQCIRLFLSYTLASWIIHYLHSCSWSSLSLFIMNSPRTKPQRFDASSANFTMPLLTYPSNEYCVTLSEVEVFKPWLKPRTSSSSISTLRFGSKQHITRATFDTQGLWYQGLFLSTLNITEVLIRYSWILYF